MIRNRWIASFVLLTVPAVFGYLVQRSEGWRPKRPKIERESLTPKVLSTNDIESLCKQAIMPVPELHAGSCDQAFATLERTLGPTAARTLAQGCRDRRAVFADGAVKLPTVSMCRQKPLPAACRAVCGVTQ